MSGCTSGVRSRSNVLVAIIDRSSDVFVLICETSPLILPRPFLIASPDDDGDDWHENERRKGEIEGDILDKTLSEIDLFGDLNRDRLFGIDSE